MPRAANGKLLDYGPFYNVLRSHQRVENFMEDFHSIGQREFPAIQVGKQFDIIRGMWDFWLARGFLTRKQIALAAQLIEELKDV